MTVPRLFSEHLLQNENKHQIMNVYTKWNCLIPILSTLVKYYLTQNWLIHLPLPFGILDALIDCEFPFSHCSRLPCICDGHELRLLLLFVILQPPDKFLVNWFDRSTASCHLLLSIAIDVILLEAWSTFDSCYLAHFVMQCIRIILFH